MTGKQWLLSGFVAFTCMVCSAANAGPIENYSPVTSSRLENPEPGNWMLYRRTYDGQGYSPLNQINTSNVKNLTPLWTFSTGRVFAAFKIASSSSFNKRLSSSAFLICFRSAFSRSLPRTS